MKTKIQAFIAANQVLLLAVVSALILVIQQAASEGPISFKALAYAAFLAVLGVVANQWRGRGLTITGIIGTFAGVAQNIYATGNFTWNEFILSALLAVMLAAASALQPVGQVPAEEAAVEA
jgi:hypothetical protein